MHQHHDHGMTGGPIAEDDKAICPVMHLPVSKHEAKEKGLVREFEGNTYYLCCPTCATSFDNNPAQYANDKEVSL